MKKIAAQLIAQLKKKEIGVFDIPEELEEDRNIIVIERELGNRLIGKRGYDVINDRFFVEETICNEMRSRQIVSYFEDFISYYKFLDGQIYDNACYYGLDFSKINTKKKLDLENLKSRKALLDYTIDDTPIFPSAEEIEAYKEKEELKKTYKTKIKELSACKSVAEFKALIDNEMWCKENGVWKLFFWSYVFDNITDQNALHILIQYLLSKDNLNDIKALGTIFDPDSVWEEYCSLKGNVSKDEKRNIRKLKLSMESIKLGTFEEYREAFFDEDTHYFFEIHHYILLDKDRIRGLGGVFVWHFFETLDELVCYRKGDLTNCDLSKAINLMYDFSKCKIDHTTKLPTKCFKKLTHVVKKQYIEKQFVVLQKWYNSKEYLIEEKEDTFNYYFDFIYFLKNDLSEADLLMCDGLLNLKDVSDVCLSNAKLSSLVCDKFGIAYTPYIPMEKTHSFSIIEENEEATEFALQSKREELGVEIGNGIECIDYKNEHECISYISDIHLMHKIQHLKPKSDNDVRLMIRSMANQIVDEMDGTLLIGGDVSSDFAIFEMFVRELKLVMDLRERYFRVIFVLGNHELWEFSGEPLDDIVKKYEILLNECGMYLLHNCILYKDSQNSINRINTEQILQMDTKALYKTLVTAKAIYFGGIGFSGYNKTFNAQNGIYRNTINRDTEIAETQLFEKLYGKIVSALPDKRVIIFTHMPIDCWHKEVEYHKDYVYVSGHTHKNYFYDDGDVRIYADNQIGYRNNQLHVKCFDVENSYDIFGNYEDGIYEITRKEYKEFYNGKHLRITCNREFFVLYMLKKNGYYCFIQKTNKGNLSILNGGALKSLKSKDIKFYYDSMDTVIRFIKKPLDTYTDIQKKIASEIKRIGGSGHIHGCIIDIDGMNHVYVNPVDSKITGYWASDIINKQVYSSIPTLLQEQCPEMYLRYCKYIKEKGKNLPMISNPSNIGLNVKEYLNTDIYNASREIKKMQKLHSNILTTWYNVNEGHELLE